MRLLSSAFPLSTRDGYHEPSISQHDTANKISIISLPSVTMKPLSSSSFPLSTWIGHHQSSVCRNETAIISLPSVNKRPLSSAFPLSTWNNYQQPSLCQQDTAIICLPPVKMRQLSSAFPLSTWHHWQNQNHQMIPVNMRPLAKSALELKSNSPCMPKTCWQFSVSFFRIRSRLLPTFVTANYDYPSPPMCNQ